MSDAHLPDDVSQWPSDPFALLGVSRSGDEQALRAAYVRLLRRFKPEQNPEAFRRIRDAYEFLLERVGYWQYLDGADTENAAEDDAPSTTGSEAPTRASPDRAEDAAQAHRFEPAVAVWQAVEAGGELNNAYARLVALERERPGDEETCVRLYWLLRLAPHLVPPVDRCEWLRRAVHHNGTAWMAMHLFGRELEFDAQRAEQATPDRLLGAKLSPDEILGLLTARWRGLSRAQNWQPIAGDVESLRGRFETDRVAWLRLLLAGIGQLAWISDANARQAVGDWIAEIDEHAEEHDALEYALDRRDYLMAMVAQYIDLFYREVMPVDLAVRLPQVLSQAWNAAGDGWHRSIIDYLGDLLVDHVEALRLWTRAAKVAPMVVDYLVDQTMSLYFDRFDNIDGSRTMKLMVAFRRSLGHCHWADYDNCRLELLAFCLTEHIALAELPALLPQVLPPAELSGSGIDAHLAADRALQLVSAGMRIVESA